MVDTRVNLLLQEFWDMKLPIDPELFANKLGITVVIDEDLGYKSGYLDAENKVIHVKASDPKVRQRFTIAHELGHYCLGHGSANRDTTDYSWLTSNPNADPEKERDANSFAAKLLMPAVAFKILIDNHKIRSGKRLAEIFDVSSEALYWRMKNLGYFL